MGTLLALLLIFGGANAIAVAVKSFAKGMREGRARARTEAHDEMDETPEQRVRLERWRGNID